MNNAMIVGAVALSGFMSVASPRQTGETPHPSTAIPIRQHGSPRLGSSDWEELSARYGGAKAETKPCRDVTMAFTISSEVREVLVKGGDRVATDQLLVRARDADVVALVEGQRLQAANDNEVKAAELALELAELSFKRLQEAGEYSVSEFDQLRIQAATSKVQLEQAKVRLELEKRRLEQAEGQLERYRLKAPFEALVEEVKVDVGQGIREAEPVIRLVDVSKLWLEAYAPTRETMERGTKAGDTAWVLVDLPGKPKLVEGKILYLSPVADSVSQLRRVRVEVENIEGWPAGTPARVSFQEPVKEWDEYRVLKKVEERVRTDR